MKVKIEYLGQIITTFNGNYTTTFTVDESFAKEHKYYTSIGLGYLFEDKVKFKGVENEPT